MDNLSFDNREGYIWYNGNILEWKNANVHVLNHGLHYASCVFEGERAYRGKIFETVKHTERLFNSAKSLDMEIPFSQKEILEALLKAYLDRLPDNMADQQLKNIRDDFDNLFFCWAGKKEKHQPHYYRIQGRRIFVEYDNTQRGANHIHTVWRDLENDFGGDVLKSHYSTSPHHKHG